jgi:hypothetical protein
MTTAIDWYQINRQIVCGSTESLAQACHRLKWEPGIETQKVYRLYRLELERRLALMGEK